MRIAFGMFYIVMGIIAFVATMSFMEVPYWAVFPLGWSCGASIGYGIKIIRGEY